MKNPDAASVRFRIRPARLLKLACSLDIQAGLKAREKLTGRLLGILHRVCEKNLSSQKAGTLRKRLIPGIINLGHTRIRLRNLHQKKR